MIQNRSQYGYVPLCVQRAMETSERPNNIRVAGAIETSRYIFQLCSSFTFVRTGARETVWVGIDANTGDVLYECGSRGCNSEQAARGGARRVLVLRRHSHTVRALDPRQGSEKLVVLL